MQGFTNAARHVVKGVNDWSSRRALQRTQAAIQIEQKQIENFRNRHPVQIVGVPDLTSLQQISSLLDEFIASVKSYRPQLLPYDDRFRSVTFSYPFEFFFKRKNCADDGPDPEKMWITLDAGIKPGRPLESIYTSLTSASEFPVREPTIVLDDPPSPPRLPNIHLPTLSIKIISVEDGREIDAGVDFIAKAYAPELDQVETLWRTAKTMRDEIKTKWQVAKEEQDLMDIFIANQKLKLRELQQSISEEYQASKKRFEAHASEQLAAIQSVYNDYRLGTKEGIEEHFSLGLETLPLPLPSGFPWRVFYDRDEHLIQINQRVPFLTDIIVKRPDSNRAPAKRDAENFLRRLIPSISLHIATNVAANDPHNHVSTIAVNCWSRYFEKSTGKLQDAFVSSLKVEKETILEMDLTKADPLDAFRALRGAFVYSTEEIVPIEPQIRPDKNDKRFVAGKEVLEGMGARSEPSDNGLARF